MSWNSQAEWQTATYIREQEESYKCMITGLGHQHSAAKELSNLFRSVVDFDFDWTTIPPCPLPHVLPLLKSGGNVQKAKEMLITHASFFESVTQHPSYKLFLQIMAEGREKARKLITREIIHPTDDGWDYEEHVRNELMESLEKNLTAYDATFMKAIGSGWCQHTTLCAIAHRYHLLNIVELINQGNITSALAEVRGNTMNNCSTCIQLTCEKWRTPNEPATGNVDGLKVGPASLLASSSSSSSSSSKKARTVTTPSRLHRLFQTMCTVLDHFALQMDTTALVMLRRTCTQACQYHPDVPIYTERHRSVCNKYGLASRLALSYQQQMQQLDKEESMLLKSTSAITANKEDTPNVIPKTAKWDVSYHTVMYSSSDTEQNMITEVHHWIVERRRHILFNRFQTNKLTLKMYNYDVLVGICNGSRIKASICSGESNRNTLLNSIMEATHAEPAPFDRPAKQYKIGSELTEDVQNSLLVAACKSNNYPAVHFLLYELGICPGCAHDYSGTTSMHAAASVGNIRIMHQLCADGTIGASQPMPPEGQSVLDDEGRSVLGCAIENGHVHAVRWLIEECGWGLEHLLERRIVAQALSSWQMQSVTLRRVREDYHWPVREDYCPGDYREEMEMLLRFYLSTDDLLQYLKIGYRWRTIPDGLVLRNGEKYDSE